MDEMILPAGFEELVPFVRKWAKPDCQARIHERYQSDMSAIEEFYHVANARMADMFAALKAYPLGSYPPNEQRLYQMLLALGHVAHAVERHGKPRADHTPYPNTVTITQGPLPA